MTIWRGCGGQREARMAQWTMSRYSQFWLSSHCIAASLCCVVSCACAFDCSLLVVRMAKWPLGSWHHVRPSNFLLRIDIISIFYTFFFCVSPTSAAQSNVMWLIPVRMSCVSLAVAEKPTNDREVAICVPMQCISCTLLGLYSFAALTFKPSLKCNVISISIVVHSVFVVCRIGGNMKKSQPQSIHVYDVLYNWQIESQMSMQNRTRWLCATYVKYIFIFN